MNYLITILVAFLGSSAFTAIINHMVQKKVIKETDILKMREDLLILKTAQQASLRNSLRKKYKEAKKQGYTTFDDRDDFDFLYTQYHALGANGVMTDCYNKFMELEIKEEF